MVQLIKRTWAVVEPEVADVSVTFHDLLFRIAPDIREMFPVNIEVRRAKLVRGIAHVVQMVDRPDDLVPFLNQLGRDYRKFHVRSRHYEAIGTAMLGALRHHLGPRWTPEVERAWAEAYTVVARSMQDAAEADPSPAVTTATVVDHRRLTWDLALIRVRPESPVNYRAGQYMSVEVPQRPRLWRYLSPANAPRRDGIIEFHVHAVEGGWVSRALVSHTQPGDVWRLGPPLGRLSVDRESGRNVLMIAGGTGLAPLRALLDDLSRWGKNPAVHLYYGGRTAEDLYDLADLRALAATNPWLRITPVTEDGSLPGAERGTLAEVVTRHGAWPEHHVLVSGSPQMIKATISRLLVAGSSLDQIAYDPFALD
ncbi:FAD-binding oxidoreductase [Haloechinothrix sp. LS1_15]|uniref:FAD-binding oxidoreductase n=1 Tax=Haloechinothrix sp. LS1_15 TaxID=2652248 RepID=UPI002946CA84|nr:FAD-binding oxidoreductase [Haloechinothrix sp. LS1_15]MDV6011132.1 flavohemoprotein [Haloechinothrix sp. LS1_15]